MTFLIRTTKGYRRDYDLLRRRGFQMSRLDEVVHALKVDVAIITVPEAAATDTYAELLAAGVNGIMNFSPVTLKPVRTREGIMPVVHNINIGLELEQIFYELKFPRT